MIDILGHRLHREFFSYILRFRYRQTNGVQKTMSTRSPRKLITFDWAMNLLLKAN